MEQLTIYPIMEIAKKLNESIAKVLGASAINGFEKAFLMAQAIQDLRSLLTPEYMKPIMALQGSKLGFRTDKDRNKDGTKGNGYPEAIVKDCVIEAVLNGLQVTGNQFNIISGNTYPTKEGCGYLLSLFKGLKYTIIPNLPRINNEQTSAAIIMKISWSINGSEIKTESLEVPIKMFPGFTTTDAIIGKATRKARAWLIGTITGNEITDGEVEDAQATVINSTAPSEETQVESIDRITQLKESQRKAKLSGLKNKIENATGDQKTALENELEQLETTPL